jgi:hypothetical protein
MMKDLKQFAAHVSPQLRVAWWGEGLELRVAFQKSLNYKAEILPKAKYQKEGWEWRWAPWSLGFSRRKCWQNKE